jgi:hypothetical protein
MKAFLSGAAPVAVGLAPAISSAVVAVAPLIPLLVLGAGIGLLATKAFSALESRSGWTFFDESTEPDSELPNLDPASSDKATCDQPFTVAHEVAQDSGSEMIEKSRPSEHAELSLGYSVPAFEPAGQARRIVADDLARVFADGPLTRSEEVAALRELTGCGATAAYKALEVGSRFSDRLTQDEFGRFSFSALPGRVEA